MHQHRTKNKKGKLCTQQWLECSQTAHTISHHIIQSRMHKARSSSPRKNNKNKATFSISSFLGNLRTWKPSFQELASARGPHALFSPCLLSISLFCSLFTLHQASRLSEKRKTSIKTGRKIYSSEKASLML